MNPWLYQNNPITSIDQVPEKSLGFVYRIIYSKTGQIYIGRKLLYGNKIKTINKKKKKIKVESDWLTYHSSSPTIKSIIELEGHDVFTREILLFVQSKGELLYLEEDILHHTNALINPNYINDNIRSKIYRNWVKREEFQKDIIELKRKLVSSK